MMPLFGPGSRGGVDTLARRPLQPPARQPVAVVWRKLVLRVPPACSDCLKSGQIEIMNGVPFMKRPGRAAEERKEIVDGRTTMTYHCSSCALDRHEAEAKTAKAEAAKHPVVVQRRRR